MSTVNKEEEAIKKIFGGKWGQTDTWQGALAGALGSAIGNASSTLIGGSMTDNIGGKIGSGISNIGGNVGSVLSAVNPLIGGIVTAASGILGGLTTRMFGADYNEEAIANIENQNKRMSNTLVASGSNSDIMSQWDNQEWGNNFTKSDLGKEGWFSNAVTDKYSTLQKEQQTAQNRVLASYDNAIENTNKQSTLNMLANYSAHGGPIHIAPSKRGTFTAAATKHGMGVQEFARKVLANKENYSPTMVKKANFARNAAKWHADGGFLTHGGIFDNGIIFINNGGTHENNPHDGVQIGVDPQGTPNLVEENEVIWNDYVFSDRLKVNKEIRSKYKMRGSKEMSFAEVAKKLSKESEERPNDPISKRGLEDNMLKLAVEQEAMKEDNPNKDKNMFDDGGKIKSLNYNGGIYIEVNFDEIPKNHGGARAAGYPIFKKSNGQVTYALNADEVKKGLKTFAIKGADGKWYVRIDNSISREAKRTADFKKKLGITDEQEPKSGTDKNEVSGDSAGPKNEVKEEETIIGPNGKAAAAPQKEETSAATPAVKDETPAKQPATQTPVSKDAVKGADSPSENNKKIESEHFNTSLYDENWHAGEMYTDKPNDLPEFTITSHAFSNDTYDYLDDHFYTPIDPVDIFIKEGSKEQEISASDILEEASKLYPKKVKTDITKPVIMRTAQEMLGIPYNLNYTTEKVKDSLPETIDMIDTTIDDNDPFDLSFLRYLEALGPLTVLSSNLRKRDYSRANRLEEAAAKLSTAPVVSYTPISTRLGYDPMDRNYLANRLAAEAGATRNAILNSTNPSRNAALLAADYNAQNLIGDAYRKADEYNLAQRQAVAQFNRGTEQANAELGLKASMANAEMAQKASQLGFAGLSNAIDMKNKIDNLKASSLATNLSNLFTSLGNIGKEETYKKWIKENPEYAKYFRGK